MIVKDYHEVTEEAVSMDGAQGAHIRWLISDKEHAPNFAMRRFRIEVGGYTPYHKHPHEHETYILKGEGVMVTDKGEIPFKEGTFLFVEPYEMHQFKNTGDTELEFLCMIPLIKNEC